MLDVGCFLMFFVFPSISILALAVVGCISLFRVPLAVMSCFLDQRYEASTKSPTFAMRNQTLRCQAQRIEDFHVCCHLKLTRSDKTIPISKDYPISSEP